MNSPAVSYETFTDNNVEPPVKTTYITFQEKGKPKLSIYHSQELIPQQATKRNFLNIFGNLPGRRRSAIDAREEPVQFEPLIRRSASAEPRAKPPPSPSALSTSDSQSSETNEK